MNAKQILEIISKTIATSEEAGFNETVKARAAEGWANPTLQAQNEWQGHDNQIVFGTFADALKSLTEYGEEPTGLGPFDPETDGDPQHWLVNHLDSSGVIGTGAPLAYIGVRGYFTLICEGATDEEIATAALECLPEEYESDESA